MNKQSFNQNWRFHLGDPAGNRWDDNDASYWRHLDLPHDWSIELPRKAENPSGNSGGFFEMGRGWYRKAFHAPAEWQGKKVFIEFEGVYMNAEIWLNQSFLGRHPYGYTSFVYDLTPHLTFGSENVLRVMVDNSGQLNSRWYSGSGIYRPVWLMVTEPVHLAPWGVYVSTPEISAKEALPRIVTTVDNDSASPVEARLISKVYAPEGKLCATTETIAPISAGGRVEFIQDIPVAAPLLWSPESPHLYRLDSEVIVAGQAQDTQSTPFGIRSLHFSAEKGFLLNGQPIKLKGGCVHHDNGVLGATSYARAEERKVEIHKASGYNAIRTAHNPPASAFLEACDRLGMLVMDEAFDCWRIGKNHHDYHVTFEDWWQRDIENMVIRDRNHPCIILWSIGNEVIERDGRSGGAVIAKMLSDEVRRLDPTRPISCAICNVWDKHKTWSDTDVVFESLGVGGYNYMFSAYESDHARHPQRMMIGTESAPKEAFDNWMLVEAHPYVLGDFVWTSLDYLGEAGIGRVNYEAEVHYGLGAYPWNQANCGDLDLCGFKRPQSYYRDILWKTGSPLYIAVHTPPPDGKSANLTYWGWWDANEIWTWPGQEGKPLKVDVYSACEQVELFLNGKSLGVKPSGRAERFTASFEVPYQPGELKAVGINGNIPSAERRIETASAPAALRLSPDRSTLRAGCDDLSYVTVEVVDAQGRICPQADHPIYFTTQGDGILAAVGSAKPDSEESYRGHFRCVHRGRALAVVKAGTQTGSLILRAQADGLSPAECGLTVK
jgi:beta-galactosidase